MCVLPNRKFCQQSLSPSDVAALVQTADMEKEKEDESSLQAPPPAEESTFKVPPSFSIFFSLKSFQVMLLSNLRHQMENFLIRLIHLTFP